MNGPHARVLILGGGDGLAAREVLRHPGVRRVDIVEPDADVVRLARHDTALSALNHHAYDDPRVHEVTADAFSRLRHARSTYDVVISDLPDPCVTAATKLYSQEFYGLARRVLAPGGRLVVHAGPLSGRHRAFWTVDATIRAAGLFTRPYRVGGRDSGFAARPGRHAGRVTGPGGAAGSVGDWGFLLASRAPAPLRLDSSCPQLRTLTQAALTADARAAFRSRLQPSLPPSTLVHPRYTD